MNVVMETMSPEGEEGGGGGGGAASAEGARRPRPERPRPRYGEDNVRGQLELFLFCFFEYTSMLFAEGRADDLIYIHISNQIRLLCLMQSLHGIDMFFSVFGPRGTSRDLQKYLQLHFPASPSISSFLICREDNTASIRMQHLFLNFYSFRTFILQIHRVGDVLPSPPSERGKAGPGHKLPDDAEGGQEEHGHTETQMRNLSGVGRT